MGSLSLCFSKIKTSLWPFLWITCLFTSKKSHLWWHLERFCSSTRVFWVLEGHSLEQLESGKSPSVRSNQRARLCRSTFQIHSRRSRLWFWVQTPKVVRYRHDRKTEPPGSGASGVRGGKRSVLDESAVVAGSQSVAFIHQREKSHSRWAPSEHTFMLGLLVQARSHAYVHHALKRASGAVNQVIIKLLLRLACKYIQSSSKSTHQLN